MISNENMLQPFQIIYASLGTRRLTRDEIRDLLHISRKNNHSVDVGGLLVYHDNCFLQVLEGPRIAVEAIFMRIKTDPRHRNVKLLLRHGVGELEFNDWSMAYIDSDESSRGLKGYVDYLKELDKKSIGDSIAMRVLRRFKKDDWRAQILEEFSKSA
ncbi:BLUF domain-containing protein [Maritalea porphyrae]|jgi:hypothetical protein|uniref:BLUF domain-containing protein n=1 Tax=Maritalea porphyrae TaxID=880732 RepID=UPI0022AFB3B2|nr:BLUF domain-containing protein [Maritalea porphyrae]MCZ4271352.1 BLUF domain-containing protein [Maritalea porphyrae]